MYVIRPQLFEMKLLEFFLGMRVSGGSPRGQRAFFSLFFDFQKLTLFKNSPRESVDFKKLVFYPPGFQKTTLKQRSLSRNFEKLLLFFKVLLFDYLNGILDFDCFLTFCLFRIVFRHFQQGSLFYLLICLSSNRFML